MEEYIKPELLTLVPVIYFVGVGIKKSHISDRLIPVLLGIISVLITGLFVFSTSETNTWKDILSAIITSITQGILIAAASVYVNQIYVQNRKDE